MATECSVSLVICTYRRAQQVERLVLSLGRQTLPPDEVLIVDGSPDRDTEAVLRTLAGRAGLPPLRYNRVGPEHRGLTRQRNYGVVRARGTFVAFLDDDTVPEPEYFAELMACFDRHPECVAIGGYITNEGDWRRIDPASPPARSVFRFGAWERRDDVRWRLREAVGLGSPLPPGQMPRSGHARPVSFLPCDGSDHPVEFVMGGASIWRTATLARHRFSSYFEGYGLYEDLDFCLRAGQDGSLYLCTRAQLAHYHAAPGRPNAFAYGRMVVRNSCFVWRRRWPQPPLGDRARWWATTVLLAGCRLANAALGPGRDGALAEALGRAAGMWSVICDPPREARGHSVAPPGRDMLAAHSPAATQG